MMQKIITSLILLTISSNLISQQFLWGVTYMGGINNDGIIYNIDIESGIYTKVHDFDAMDELNGANPTSTLVTNNNGLFYGTAINGGNYQNGVLYSYNPSMQAYNIIFHFTESMGHPSVGDEDFESNCDITILNDSLLCGYSYTSDSVFIYGFNINTQQLEFIYPFPYYNLSQGKPSGLTTYNDSLIMGVVGWVKILFTYNWHDNSYSWNSNYPSMAGYGISLPTLYSNGNYYLVCKWGGYDETGIIYEFNHDLEEMNEVYNFDRSYPCGGGGCSPIGGLAYSLNNEIVGTTTEGSGSVIKYDLDDNLPSLLHCFNGEDGSDPHSSLVVNSSNIAYGVTSKGGTNNYGVVFKYDLNNNIYTKVFDFDGLNGKYPRTSSLLLTGDNVGIDYNSNYNNTIEVFPNPAFENIIVKTDSNNDFSLTIYNLNGEIVIPKTIQKNKKVDISKLNIGIYIIKIEINNSAYYSKLIKQ